MENRIIEELRRGGKPLAPEILLDKIEEKDEGALAVEGLLASGRLILTRKRKLALPEQTGLIYGRMQGNARGFGFFIPDDGSSDMFVPADAMHGAMHGDKVWVRPSENISRNGSSEAEIIMIALRGQSNIVGAFETDSDLCGGYVVPDETKLYMDVMVQPGNTMDAKHGDKVVVRITQYSDGRRPLIGEIIEVFGNKNEAGTDILSIIKRLGLADTFTKGVLRQAKGLNKPVDTDNIARREDLRGQTIITIDGADAKDLDDAISLVKLGENYLLGVHIADVSAYVEEGTPLDKEAYKRGTSVYFPDRVLPMFPPDISNGACSLNPNEDKLTLSCTMEINPAGKVIAHRLSESVIRSAHRMTYDDVNAIYTGNKKLSAKFADILPMLESMRELTKILNEKRVKQGSIDFDIDEAQIILDKSGKAIDVQKHERGISNRMIEEFMLLANETVAKHATDLGMPFVYRVHETPDKSKLADLNTFLGTMGYGIKNLANVQPKTLQKILLKAKGTNEESVISRVVLRAMRKARYAPEALGHFGLAIQDYCHFTSPIRRYPDLMVHRMLKEIMHGEMTKKRIETYAATLPEITAHCSACEIAAMEAERAADDLKKCEYMQQHLGAVESGVISGVAHFGFFVQLSNIIEGMVRVASITDDFYICDEKNYRMVGKNGGRVFSLGDIVRIRVIRADTSTGNIDFELVQGMGTGNAQNTNEKKNGNAKSKAKSSNANTRNRSAKKTAGIAGKEKK